jgi:hypothetical protein
MLSEKHCDLCWRGQLTTDVKSRWVEEDGGAGVFAGGEGCWWKIGRHSVCSVVARNDGKSGCILRQRAPADGVVGSIQAGPLLH